MENRTVTDGPPKQGWIQMLGVHEAEGRLKQVYAEMRANMGSRPSVYSTPTGDAPNIVKSHSRNPLE